MYRVSPQKHTCLSAEVLRIQEKLLYVKIYPVIVEIIEVKQMCDFCGHPVDEMDESGGEGVDMIMIFSIKHSQLEQFVIADK